MKVAISAVRTKDLKINRLELVRSLQAQGCEVFYIGQDSPENIHPDYERHEVNFLPLPLSRSNTNPLQEIKAIRKTHQILKGNNIETLIVYGIRTFPTMVIAARLAGLKRVLCIVNGSGRLFQLKGLRGFFIKVISYPMLWLSLLLANKVFFQNPDDLKMIVSKGLLWRKNYGLVNGSGVNLNTFKLNLLESKPVFTMIGRLTGAKGVNEYVEAAKIVKQTYPNSEFNLIGPMDDSDSSINMTELKQAVKDGTINLHGRVDDVTPYLKLSRIFVLPSYYEGTPRAVLEAMAMGRPILTTDVTGCRETVTDGVNGFKVPAKDSKCLAEKMMWMIDHPSEVEKMGKESRELCELKYDVHKVNEKILKSIRF